jgi:hypothetical protein
MRGEELVRGGVNGVAERKAEGGEADGRRDETASADSGTATRTEPPGPPDEERDGKRERKRDFETHSMVSLEVPYRPVRPAIGLAVEIDHSVGPLPRLVCQKASTSIASVETR